MSRTASRPPLRRSSTRWWGGVIDITVSRRDLSTSGDSLVLWHDVTPGDYYVLFVKDGGRSVLNVGKVELYQLDVSG